MIHEKFEKSTKLEGMMAKYDNVYFFMLNAEHNCRFLKFPYVGKSNDGSLADYNSLFERIRDQTKDFGQRVGYLDNTFKKYIKRYYYSAVVRKSYTRKLAKKKLTKYL